MIYGILWVIVLFALIALTELGYGVIAFVPLTLLCFWLMEKFLHSS